MYRTCAKSRNVQMGRWAQVRFTAEIFLVQELQLALKHVVQSDFKCLTLQLSFQCKT